MVHPMDRNYQVRLAKDDELHLLIEIEEVASTRFENTRFALEVAQPSLSISFLQQQQQAELVWVATDPQDQPVGFAVVLRMGDDAHLHELSVVPAHGRRGIGTALTQATIQFAQESGLKGVTLSTFRDVAWNAPFYRKLGFREMSEGELGDELLEIRKKEVEAGLPTAERLIMRLVWGYRGRLAPTPTGHLHLGHAKTFWVAQQRAEQSSGRLILRIEDLDQARCKPQYRVEMLEDLAWFGFRWQEGPDIGGEYGSYEQQQRRSHYAKIWQQLNQTGSIYPSPHSRKDVTQALSAPHEGEGEIIFPIQLRPESWESVQEPGAMNWRFRVPDGEAIAFTDQNLGPQSFVAGEDFGDFIVWRRDGFPSYELAVVADDQAMAITEVVRGEDLLLSTAKQILLYRALGWEHPQFYHCPLVRDEQGRRLAKRDGARSLRSLREQGQTPAEIRATW